MSSDLTVRISWRMWLPAVGLQGPDLHLAEPLAAELRLASQRLLGDEAVWACGTRVDLVLDQVVELEHVDDPDRDVVVEGVASAPVAQLDLAAAGQARALQLILDQLLRSSVEDRGGDLHPHRGGGPAQVGLEDLAQVHPARHAERVE